MQFVNESKNLTEKRVKILRCDNGEEYLNNRFYKFAKEKGITMNNCPAHVHELNGTAERFNRRIMNMASCLLAEAKVHKCYWPEIMIIIEKSYASKHDRKKNSLRNIF